MSYIDDVKEKRQADTGSKQANLMLQAAMMNSQQKPSIILTDSTDLGEHISKLGDKIIDVLEAVADDKSSTAQIDRITDLLDEYRSLTSEIQTSAKEHSDKVCEALDELKTAITKVKPPVVIPAPAVNLTEREIDLKPLLKKLDLLVQPKQRKVSLNDFRAQDIDNDSGNMQYIGFTSTFDEWYIMENNTAENTIRYAFGNGDYSQAWTDRHNHDYGVLSEAINALQTWPPCTNWYIERRR